MEEPQGLLGLHPIGWRRKTHERIGEPQGLQGLHPIGWRKKRHQRQGHQPQPLREIDDNQKRTQRPFRGGGWGHGGFAAMVGGECLF